MKEFLMILQTTPQLEIKENVGLFYQGVLPNYLFDMIVH